MQANFNSLIPRTAVSNSLPLPLIVGVTVGALAGLGIVAGVVIALGMLIVAVLRMRKKLHLKSTEEKQKGNLARIVCTNGLQLNSYGYSCRVILLQAVQKAI